MKFVCLNCETYMTFQKVEKPTEGSLGVFFVCGSCEAKFSMVTNPGETQMVNSLGVQLGGRTEAAAPLEMTRGGLQEGVGAPATAGSMTAYLNDKIHAGQQATATASAPAPAPASAKGAPAPTSAPSSAKDGQEESTGGCPFSAMVAQMGLGGTGTGAGGRRHTTSLRPAMERGCAGTIGPVAVVCAADGQGQCGIVCAEARLYDRHASSHG